PELPHRRVADRDARRGLELSYAVTEALEIPLGPRGHVGAVALFLRAALSLQLVQPRDHAVMDGLGDPGPLHVLQHRGDECATDRLRLPLARLAMHAEHASPGKENAPGRR